MRSVSHRSPLLLHSSHLTAFSFYSTGMEIINYPSLTNFHIIFYGQCLLKMVAALIQNCPAGTARECIQREGIWKRADAAEKFDHGGNTHGQRVPRAMAQVAQRSSATGKKPFSLLLPP